jgi:proprotein convertase subtilisin/kexin type 5
MSGTLCVNPCPTGYYGNTSTYVCTACNSLCVTCSGSATFCTSCDGVNYTLNASNNCICTLNRFMDTANSNTCTFDCGATRYGDTATYTCKSCIDPCLVIYSYFTLFNNSFYF